METYAKQFMREHPQGDMLMHDYLQLYMDWMVKQGALYPDDASRLRRRLAAEIYWGHRDCVNDPCNASGMDCPVVFGYVDYSNRDVTTEINSIADRLKHFGPDYQPELTDAT